MKRRIISTYNKASETRGRRYRWTQFLTGLFVVLLLLLLFYDPLRGFHPALDPFFMLFVQAVGLVFLVLTVFCIIGLVLLAVRRLYGFGCGER